MDWEKKEFAPDSKNVVFTVEYKIPKNSTEGFSRKDRRLIADFAINRVNRELDVIGSGEEFMFVKADDDDDDDDEQEIIDINFVLTKKGRKNYEKQKKRNDTGLEEKYRKLVHKVIESADFGGIRTVEQIRVKKRKLLENIDEVEDLIKKTN